MASSKHQKVDFDLYAERYEALLQTQLSFFEGDRSYFTRAKVDIIQELIKVKPKSVLDFGCGIGLSLPFLKAAFPDAEVYGSDLSEKSLKYVRDNIPNVYTLADEEVDSKSFDLIFVSCVYHHIHPSLREQVTRRLAGLLNPGGSFGIFEHNPYNPVTQRMVSTCEFDDDAILLRPSETTKLLEDAALNINSNGFYLFFPGFLKAFRGMEKALRFLPLGGQYFVIASKD
ncbi:trans-aconitate 2-methyltransferase [Rhizobium sp. L1K21]|uniref:class I SAM-dependent methyltransferase n=1 Tax=Rhizobium sp. L1K21 TaxID=2954933 RepID=UPI00209231FF|nr:class I SAM-dependent methyltransferase [Rhizobium sp. L1K21]MCO6187964.1 class I SAM-dependent methyltransferase [Rhizobium sp. L1K21]